MHLGWRGGLVAAALALSGTGFAHAQDFPSRTIRLVVAFPAGGPTDFVARLLADKMKNLLGQTVVIENKPGANAAIGADYVAKSEPDGYTLFFTTMGAVAINPHMRTDLPYDPVKDFAPIGVTYGLSLEQIDKDHGGLAMLSPTNVINLNDLNNYLDELSERVKDASHV